MGASAFSALQGIPAARSAPRTPAQKHPYLLSQEPEHFVTMIILLDMGLRPDAVMMVIISSSELLLSQNWEGSLGA